MGKTTKRWSGREKKIRSKSTLHQQPKHEESSASPHKLFTTEDILCFIISRLRLREAVRTSVLCRAWRHIWTRLPVFRFDVASVFDAHTLQSIYNSSICPLTIEQKLESLIVKTDLFIASINSVLQQHQGDRVEELAVHFFLHKIHSYHLDAWVRFAVFSKTKKLVLYLGPPLLNSFENNPIEIELYDFPGHLLRSSSIQELSLSHCSLKLSHGFDGFNHLKGLDLYAVDITEHDMNNLLSNVSTLENLSLRNSQQWVRLIIPHHLSRLESLVVHHCFKLRKIEIEAFNLRRLHYNGLPVDIIFSRSSQLEHTEISFIANWTTYNLEFYFTKVHKNLPHLRSLNFRIIACSKVPDLRKRFCTFTHLTQLDWTWNMSIKMSLLHLTTLLDVAPFLEELKLHLRVSTRVVEKAPQSLRKLKQMLPKYPHAHLKTIEIDEFYCDKWQVELVLYLLSNAVELESVTIQKGRKSSAEIHEADVMNLSQEFSGNVKLVIV